MPQEEQINKEMVMLVYENEGHGLGNKNNQIDYHNRIMQWFGYDLKGEKAAPWILEGIPLADQKKQLENWKSIDKPNTDQGDSK
ncbi:hypothetical protein JYB64_17150 [Algoriphagus aestuarii]|nr:hypothetical protein [Algoriphagus aestuarii]